MFSVVLVFSMLSLGRILISDLVVANLLMYSLPGMILLYLAAPSLYQRCFWMSSIYYLVSMVIQWSVISFSAINVNYYLGVPNIKGKCGLANKDVGMCISLIRIF